MTTATNFKRDLAASKANTSHPAVVRAIQQAFPDVLAACTMWGDTFLNHPRCKRITTHTASRFPSHCARDSLAVAVPADLLQKAINELKGGDHASE